MRIVHVIDSLGVGGAEWLLVNYINYYKQVDPTSSHILVILKNKIDLYPKLRDALIHFQVIPFTNKSDLKSIWTFRKLIRDWKPDIVHSHLFYSTLLVRLATPRKIPKFSTYHNQSYCKSSPYYSPWFSILDRLTFHKNSFRIFVSETVRQCVETSTQSKQNGKILNNFVNVDFYPSWTFDPMPEKLRLVAIGSLKKVKNHRLLIEALTLLHDLDINIDIFGEGELREDLQNRIDECKVAINLKGNQILSSDILKNYDAFIMPSLSEGQPVSLLEAMSTGLPSLLSNIPSLKDLAGEAAIYFSSDSPEDLAKKLIQVLKDKKLLVSLSKAALDRTAPYSINNYFNEITKLYQTSLRQIANS